MHAIKALTPSSRLSLFYVLGVSDVTPAGWLQGTQIQYNVETKTRQKKKSEERTEEKQQLWRSDTGRR